LPTLSGWSDQRKKAVYSAAGGKRDRASELMRG